MLHPINKTFQNEDATTPEMTLKPFSWNDNNEVASLAQIIDYEDADVEAVQPAIQTYNDSWFSFKAKLARAAHENGARVFNEDHANQNPTTGTIMVAHYSTCRTTYLVLFISSANSFLYLCCVFVCPSTTSAVYNCCYELSH